MPLAVVVLGPAVDQLAQMTAGTAKVVLDALGYVLFFGIGIGIVITIANSPGRQGIHDRMAGGTFVIHRGKF